MSAEKEAERQALAGEYVLSLLDEADRTACERRMRVEPELAAAVAAWRERLLELDDSAHPVPPSAGLWSRIEQALDARPTRPSVSRDEVPLASRLWNALGLWLGVGLAGAAASAALAVALMVSLDAANRQPVVIAVLLSDDSAPGAVVEVFGDGSTFVAPLVDVAVPSGRTMQVWTLPDPATGPISLGLLQASGSARLQPASLPAPRPRQLYEITLEPAGGSPTGRPTGPILFKGYAERPR
jgi:anti-sigma-K factor RskA